MPRPAKPEFSWRIRCDAKIPKMADFEVIPVVTAVATESHICCELRIAANIFLLVSPKAGEHSRRATSGNGLIQLEHFEASSQRATGDVAEIRTMPFPAEA